MCTIYRGLQNTLFQRVQSAPTMNLWGGFHCFFQDFPLSAHLQQGTMVEVIDFPSKTRPFFPENPW